MDENTQKLVDIVTIIESIWEEWLDGLYEALSPDIVAKLDWLFDETIDEDRLLESLQWLSDEELADLLYALQAYAEENNIELVELWDAEQPAEDFVPEEEAVPAPSDEAMEDVALEEWYNIA
jgi:hypothetical protein